MVRPSLLLLPGPIALLLLAAPSPAAAATALTRPEAGAEITVALVAVLALTAWLLVLWLVGTALLTLGSRRGGLLGAACAGALRRVAPAAVRRVVALALGVGVVLATGGPAHAAPAAAGVASQLDRPDAASSPALLTFDWPTAALAAGTGSTAARPGSVVVRPGDSLWRLAATHLPASATAAEVAVAWPAWWSANRAVIGDDPGLLHPGQRLTVPDLPAAHPHPTTPGVQP